MPSSISDVSEARKSGGSASNLELTFPSATFDAPVELGSFKAPKTYHVVE